MYLVSIFFEVICLAWSLCASEAWGAQLWDGGFSERAADLVRRVRLPEARLQSIPFVVQDVETALRTRWPGCRALVYGSTESGLALQQSDIDCFVLLPKNNDADATAVYVEQTKSVLQQYPVFFAEFTTYTNSPIPVISFKHIPSGFKIDVNFKTIEGIYNTALIRYLVNQDERVLHLTVIVKYWAKLHKIIAHKKFPSYGIVQLVIFYLQQKRILQSVNLLQRYATPNFVENWNMGFDEIAHDTRFNDTLYELLGGFFEYYNNFDFDENLVSTFVARPVKRQLFKDLRSVPFEFYLYRHNIAYGVTGPLNISRACIQDPFHHNKNVAIDLDAKVGSRFATQFKRAALLFKESKESEFLEAILSP